jgi:hypothetical protein
MEHDLSENRYPLFRIMLQAPELAEGHHVSAGLSII